MLLLPLLALAWCQDPTPLPAVPPPQPQEEQPQAAQPPNTISQQEVEAKMAQVSETYADADRSLTLSLETPQEKLAEAATVAKRLIAEMEDLLAALPSPPPPPPSDGGGGGNSPAENKPMPKKESGEETLTPPRDMPLSEFLRDPRDDSWGKLPPRLQQTIDSASAEDVPLRYRRWLVEYHRQGIKAEK